MQQSNRLRQALRLLMERGVGPRHQARGMGQLALRPSALRAGSDGRQSVSGVVATVFGATGFLGRYVVSTIGEQGGRVVCPHRCDDMDMQHLRPMGDLGNIITVPDFTIRDDDLVKKLISKSNVVINLIGQYSDTWNFKLEEVHEDWPRRLAEFCAATPSVERLIHVSALGASADSPSVRLATKAAGDTAVMQAFPDATLMRCGPLVGVEDRFYNDIANWRFSGGVPLIDGGVNKVQPVYVVDVAEAIYRTLEFSDAKGSLYELGGPEGPMMMRDVGKIICDEMREDVKYTQIPSFFAIPFASLRDRLAKSMPMHMMTRDVMLTSSAVAEGAVDRVVKRGSKVFDDLHVVPHKTTSGIAIDHVRHWRKGGYNMGTNTPQKV